MGLGKKEQWLIVGRYLFLTFILLERCRALPPHVPGDGFLHGAQFAEHPPVKRSPSTSPKTFLPDSQGKNPVGDGKVYSQTKSITVRCYDAWMEIDVKADLFNTGVLINGDYLRLGGEDIPTCRAIQSSAEEYTIVAALSDCGNKHLITIDSLIYTNLLMYNPPSPTSGIIRMEGAVIPIECHYGRRYGLSSGVLNPTWIPFTATLSAGEALDFSLRLMHSDWLSERMSGVYYLGDVIYIEAAVILAYHTPLRIFVDSCVASVFPDKNSIPRYSFIENGCLTDAWQTGSNSHFLQRAQDDKLHIYLDAFRFHQETRDAIYITCHLRAVPITHTADPRNRACSFLSGSWSSVDGNDWICDSCGLPHGISEQPVQSVHQGLGKELSLRPLEVFPSQYGGMAPRVKQAESGPMEAKALWTTDDYDYEAAQDGQPGTLASEEVEDVTPAVEVKELEKPTPSPKTLLAGKENVSSEDPNSKEDKENGHHLRELLTLEEAIALLDKDEGSGMIEDLDKKDSDGLTTPSPEIQTSTANMKPGVSLNEEHEVVGPTAIPGNDSKATVVPSSEESNSTGPTSEDESSSDVLPSKGNSDETLSLDGGEDFKPIDIIDAEDI
ncbi:hypothetical protein GJAV_G00125860 [Gymnothorax javanicus]|nr:hypothetical protein GJAV_G00125860 [Gymnothorax javanicus]